MAKDTDKKEYTFAVGRRKESVARVRLHAGKGESTVNDQSVEKYFPGVVARVLFSRPFETTGTEGKYWVSAKVVGGGKNSQLGAVILGISRALSLADRESFRSSLKKFGFLTRDPRTRERRKVGTGGKARRKKQSPKR